MVEDMVSSKVVRILASQLGVGEEEVGCNANISTDLGADSIDLVEVLLALEEEFGLDIEEEEFGRAEKVSDLIDMISTKVA